VAGEVASPPYDVLSAEEARAMAAGNPNSFLRVNKAELEFDSSVDPYSEQVYRRGKQNLNRLINDGIMIREEKPSFYLYRLTMSGRSQTGLVALTSVEEYNQGKIKKHEHTRPEKVNDRANHISYLEAQVGLVFTTYRFNPAIDQLFKKITSSPSQTDFTSTDSVRHQLWVVDDEKDIKQIVDAFAGIEEFYIADGHHRSQSASEICRRLKEKNPHHTGQEIYNFFINGIFPDEELRIMPYNRVITDLNGLTLDEMFKRASAKFTIRPNKGEVVPSKPHQFGLYTYKQWYLMEARPGSFDEQSPTRSIDASVLGENFIGPILGITNPKTDHRIDFVGGIRGNAELVKLVDSGKFKLAFSLYPTTIEQLLKVADAGEVMPPKSTWFEPKLRSGMVVNLLTDK